MITFSLGDDNVFIRRCIPLCLLCRLLVVGITISRWLYLVRILEALAEVAWRRETVGVAHFGNAQVVTFAQHIGGFTQSQVEDEALWGFARKVLPLVEEGCARHSYFSCKCVNAEFRVGIVAVDDAHGTVEQVLIHRIGGKHVSLVVWMLAELTLQQASHIDEVIAS